MGTAVTTPLEKKRAAALRQMTKAGQEMAHQIEEKVAIAAAGKIMTAYRMGSMLAEAHADEQKYGSNYVEQLAAYLYPDDDGERPSGARGLYSLISLAKAFPHDFVKDQSKRLTATGGTLEVSHWLQLMRVEDNATLQHKLLEKTLAESWSSRQLATEIDVAGGSKKPRGPGRRPSLPTSPIAGLQQFYKSANAFANLRETMEAAVFAPVEALSNTQVSESLLDRMQLAHDTAITARDAADVAVGRLETGMERVRELLKSASAEAEATAIPAAKDTNEQVAPNKRQSGKGKAGASSNGKATAPRKTAKRRAVATA